MMSKKAIQLVTALLVIIAFLIFLLKRCSGPDYATYDVRAGGDTLNIAIEYSPTGMYMSGDTFGGLNYEVATAICRNNGIHYNIIPVSGFADAARNLKTGVYDVLIPDAAAISELKDSFLYTEPVYIDRQVLVCRENVECEDFNVGSLASDTIWVPENSPYVERLRNLSKEIGDTIYIEEVPGVGSEALVMMVAVGDIRQAVVNSRLAQKMMTSGNLGIKIAGEISFNQFQAWMLNTDATALRDSLNIYISDFKKTAEYKNIIEKRDRE